MKIIASNFKTNHTRKSTKLFIDEINNFIKINNVLSDVYIFPPPTAFDTFDTMPNLFIGAQNAYSVKNGSYTGEIGIEQLEEFNIKTILIGHSERRHILKESQTETIQKYNFYQSSGFKIIFCIGEPLDVKNEGLDSTLEYLWEQLEGIDLDYENLIIAYEPIWAIGTGKTASKADISIIHDKIKNQINKPLLYGGSVKCSNLNEILNIKNVDGVLVGSGSWDVNNLKEMIKINNKDII